MSFLDKLGDAVKSVGHALESVGEAVGDAVSEAASWVGGVFSGNAGTQPVPVDQAVVQVLGGNSEDWHRGADNAYLLSNSHSQISDTVGRIMANLEPTWTGQSADAAQHRIQKLASVVHAAANTFNTNANNVTSVAEGFDYAKRTMTPMPERPDKSFLDVASPWNTDTEDKINAYNAQAKQNLTIYKGYAATAKASEGTLVMDYGQFDQFDGGDVTLDKPTPPPTKRNDVQTEHGFKSTRNQQRTPSDTTPPWTPPPGTTTPGSHDPAPVGGHPPNGGTNDQQRPAGTTPNDGTNAAGFTPPPKVPGTFPPGSPGLVPGTGVGSGGTSTPLVGLGGVTGIGGPGGIGSGARVPSAESGRVGGTPGGGNRTGAGVPGEPGVRGGVTNAGKNAGSRVQGGPGGMASGGRGAKGEEDQEHRRKYGLNDDAAFTDDGERLVDPVTGLPVTPPTIGA